MNITELFNLYRRKPCPPSLTGGESHPSGAKIDWLTFTWLPEPDEHVGSLVSNFLNQNLSHTVFGVSCPAMFGYESAIRYYAQLDDGKQHHIARLDFGGMNKGGRARLDISGSGCSLVNNYYAVHRFITELFDCSITRIDLAVDCLEGQFTVEDAVQWYQDGDFHAGGRIPRHSLVGDWLDPKHGRTFEVGRRENGKMLRAYEKGRQLGDTSSLWTRFEVEIRNNDRVIPFDVLTQPSNYFAGSYKCLQRILSAAAERIKTIQKEGQITVEALSEHCKTAYGALINVLFEGFTSDEVVNFLKRAGVPKRLERASLSVFHQKSLPA